MRVRWFGQSAFALEGDGHTVFIDPFGNMDSATPGGMVWTYPAIKEAAAEVLLVTHEHRDHNGIEALSAFEKLVRSSAGTFDTPIGRVTGIASEHDAVAGTQRGANVIFVFEVGGIRVCHMGDFGQMELRPAQRAAIGAVDLLFVPVGGTATIDGRAAAALAEQLSPSWVVPMHYRTPRISFLETEEAFLSDVQGEVVKLSRPDFETENVRPEGGRMIVVPAPP